jgi:hypothetical protein
MNSGVLSRNEGCDEMEALRRLELTSLVGNGSFWPKADSRQNGR